MLCKSGKRQPGRTGIASYSMTQQQPDTLKNAHPLTPSLEVPWRVWFSVHQGCKGQGKEHPWLAQDWILRQSNDFGRPALIFSQYLRQPTPRGSKSQQKDHLPKTSTKPRAHHIGTWTLGASTGWRDTSNPQAPTKSLQPKPAYSDAMAASSEGGELISAGSMAQVQR